MKLETKTGRPVYNPERDWFDVVMGDNGEKEFVYFGFTYLGESIEDGEPEWRYETVTGSEGWRIPLSEFLERTANGEALSDMVCGERHWIEDLTEADLLEIICEDPTERLMWWDLDMDTPCGTYHAVLTEIDDRLVKEGRLEDDGSPYGGKSHAGETVSEFIAQLDEVPRTEWELACALEECGVRIVLDGD